MSAALLTTRLAWIWGTAGESWDEGWRFAQSWNGDTYDQWVSEGGRYS